MTAIRNALLGGALLATFAIAGVAMVAFTWKNTAPQITENQRHVLTSRLHEIIPPEAHDNDLLDDAITVQDSERLDTTAPVTVYRAYKNGAPVAALFTSVAPDGYSGPIYLLVGIHADGRIAGVRVLSHKETPGLGDPIEIERSDWITGFDGKALGKPALEQWDVKRYGGVFDQFTGATITPRAVVRAVKNTLIYFEQHRDEIFARQ
ncbi:MAG TPA: electron transport complex subunit RsxG [Gammaproteobacteria bacterium]